MTQRVFKVRYIEDGSVYNWTMNELLAEINDPTRHSDGYTPYDEKDWEEGFEAECSSYLELID